jgi:acid phosphatase (class A)
MSICRAPSVVAFAIAAMLCATITAARAEPLVCPAVPDNPVNAMIKLLAPPPCDTCEETKAELAELTEIDAKRTADEIKHATEDIDISVARFLAGAGITYDPALLETCAGKGSFFSRLSDLTKATSDNSKNTFCRTRPYDLPGNTLHPLKTVSNSPSYPSGHTIWGTAVGSVLAQMIPEKRTEIYERIADYGRSRMVVGVHYRSDVDAGKILGAALAADEFANDDAFKAAYPEATACIRGALGLPDQGPQHAEAPKP